MPNQVTTDNKQARTFLTKTLSSKQFLNKAQRASKCKNAETQFQKIYPKLSNRGASCEPKGLYVGRQHLVAHLL